MGDVEEVKGQEKGEGLGVQKIPDRTSDVDLWISQEKIIFFCPMLPRKEVKGTVKSCCKGTLEYRVLRECFKHKGIAASHV